jgi:hypothetical protein
MKTRRAVPVDLEVRGPFWYKPGKLEINYAKQSKFSFRHFREDKSKRAF